MTDGEAPTEALRQGDVIWAQPEIAIGREQAGRRPALVVASASYLDTVETLSMVVPLTSVDRGWPNHVEVVGSRLEQRSWAMSEQVRTIARERVVGRAGRADDITLAAVRGWLADFLDL